MLSKASLRKHRYNIMIQRIQSIFFLLAALLNLGVFLLPVWQFMEGSNIESLTAMEAQVTVEGGSQSYLMTEDVIQMLPAIAAILSSLFLLVVLFTYKNRLRQIQLSHFAILLLMIHLVAWVGLSLQGPFHIGNAVGSSSPWMGFGFPIAAILFAWLGRRAVAKDEALVRSSERFR